jgi:hypothetical protein
MRTGAESFRDDEDVRAKEAMMDDYHRAICGRLLQSLERYGLEKIPEAR